MNKLREIPPICLLLSLILLIIGKLRMSKKFVGQTIKMDDDQEFTIFRHIRIHKQLQQTENCVFVVRFKFAHLSHKANKLASIIPMLLITGFPGFMTKIYAVNFENGYWQGMYQWKSLKHLEEYKKSFVYRMMNKRAIKETIQSFEIDNKSLYDFIEELKLN